MTPTATGNYVIKVLYYFERCELCGVFNVNILLLIYQPHSLLSVKEPPITRYSLIYFGFTGLTWVGSRELPVQLWDLRHMNHVFVRRNASPDVTQDNVDSRLKKWAVTRPWAYSVGQRKEYENRGEATAVTYRHMLFWGNMWSKCTPARLSPF